MSYSALSLLLDVEPWYVVLATSLSATIPLLVILVSFTMKAYSRITEVHIAMFGSKSERGNRVGIVGEITGLKEDFSDMLRRVDEIEHILERWNHAPEDGG